MKRILAIAHSYYMLLVLINLRTSVYKDNYMELILTDDSKGSDEIFKSIKESGIFEKCHYLKKAQFAGRGNDKADKLCKGFISIISPKELIKEAGLEILDTPFDTLLVYVNCRYEEQVIFSYLKTVNPDLNCELYEEGFVSYYSPMGIFYKQKNNTNIKYRNLLSHIGRGNGLIENNIRCAWCFKPDLVQYSDSFEIKEIPAFHFSADLTDKINDIFKYNKEECYITEPVIFLEDSYYTDGYETDDIEFVKRIVNIVGENNVAIKLHPRTKFDRFKEIGIKTYSKPFPLELFMMNTLEPKIFVTMNSGAPLSCIMNFNINIIVIMLFKCSKYASRFEDNNLFETHLENIRNSCTSGKLIIPENIREFEDIFNTETSYLTNI